MNCPNITSKIEDRRLKNWKDWVEIRKKFHLRMLNIQKRRPSELLLNFAEDCCTIREMRTLQEYAKIPVITSNRGKPSFWSVPAASKKFPSLLSVRPKQKDFEVPEIETIGVPTAIQREKEIFTGEERKQSTWFQSKYLKERNKELKKDIKRIAHHIPNTKELIVSGAKPTIESNDAYSEPVQSPEQFLLPESDNNLDQTKSDENFAKYCPVKSLQIENAVFTENGLQYIKKYRIFVNYEIGKDDIVSETLELKNVGEVSLRYHWKLHAKKRVLEDIIPHRIPNYSFIFTKNENIIPPNSTNKLTIYFKTNKPGFYKEKWELRTDPNVFVGSTTNGKFLLNLYACAESANFAEREAAIINRIEEGMKFTAIEDMLLNLLTRSQAENLTTYEQTSEHITEKDIFEAVNAKFGPPGTLPFIYHFNEEAVGQLKCIYDALKTASDPPVWSYKIDDVNYLIEKCETAEEENYYKFSYNEIINHIYKSNMVENEEREKYENIYVLLSVMIDKTSEKVYELRNKYKIPHTEKYPAMTAEILINQEETFDINCRSKLYFSDVTQRSIEKLQDFEQDEAFKNLPSELMKSISFTNVDAKYKLYQKETYRFTDEKPTGKLSKTDKKGKKSKKSDGSENKQKFDLKKTKSIASVQQLSISHLFFQETKVKPDYLTEDSKAPTKDDVYMYHYNLNVSIYLLLCETVNEIENVLSYLKSNKKIARNVLRTCIALGIPTVAPTCGKGISDMLLNSLVTNIYNMKDIISDVSSTSESKTSCLSDISASYSYSDEFKTLAFPYKPKEVDMVDAQTETDGQELYPLFLQNVNIQTEDDGAEYDLVTQIENELNATSVQYIKRPMVDKAIQVASITSVEFLEQEENSSSSNSA